MIHITQGHQQSISLEVLFKSLAMISPSVTAGKLVIHASQESIKKNLEVLKLTQLSEFSSNTFSIYGHSLDFRSISSSSKLPQSTLCLEQALDSIEQGDVLLTLPTSKDQLILDGNLMLGHTEFLREKFQDQALPMCFLGSRAAFLLLTDHVSHSQVIPGLDCKPVFSKISNALKGFSQYFSEIEHCFVSGLNPHAGEGGLLGGEERALERAIGMARNLYPQVQFMGPLPGDSLHYHFETRNSLFVYCTHDQGLNVFKSIHGLLGANITFGLPFVRLSPDHGTAFELWGKNLANPFGCHEVLSLALSRLNHVHQ
jgi:4-hydroxythreonine-4-phosphate dehydrogenase